MDGRTFRYHDNHEFFRATTKVGEGGEPTSHTQTVARKRPQNGGQRARSPSRRASPPLHGGRDRQRAWLLGQLRSGGQKGHVPGCGYAASASGPGGGFGVDLRSPLLSDAGCV